MKYRRYRLFVAFVVCIFMFSQNIHAEDYSINWAVDDFEGLRMGMSKSDLERILGRKLKPLGMEMFRSSGLALWHGTKVVFSNKLGCHFIFSNDQLIYIWFCSFADYEDHVLTRLFQEYGNARYKNGYNNGGCNFFDDERTVIETPRRIEQDHINVYQWTDRETTIDVCDQIDRGERFLTVSISPYDPRQ